MPPNNNNSSSSSNKQQQKTFPLTGGRRLNEDNRVLSVGVPTSSSSSECNLPVNISSSLGGGVSSTEFTPQKFIPPPSLLNKVNNNNNNRKVNINNSPPSSKQHDSACSSSCNCSSSKTSSSSSSSSSTTNNNNINNGMKNSSSSSNHDTPIFTTNTLSNISDAIILSELNSPTPDVHILFTHFDNKYFRNRLSTCTTLRWSAKMTLCAGICYSQYQKYTITKTYGPRVNSSSGFFDPTDILKKQEQVSQKICTISLSECLLKFRPPIDTISTLIHEMIHAYLFIDSNVIDRDGHGDNFKWWMTFINSKENGTGIHITIYHTFHAEVDFYRQHHWKCRKCGLLIKRAMNRAPNKHDDFFPDHEKKCGGSFVKIKEPEKEIDKKKMGNYKGIEKSRKFMESFLTKKGSSSSTNNSSSSSGNTTAIIKDIIQNDDSDISSSQIVSISDRKKNSSIIGKIKSNHSSNSNTFHDDLLIIIEEEQDNNNNNGRHNSSKDLVVETIEILDDDEEVDSNNQQSSSSSPATTTTTVSSDYIFINDDDYIPPDNVTILTGSSSSTFNSDDNIVAAVSDTEDDIIIL